jgi:hypothetical protein
MTYHSAAAQTSLVVEFGRLHKADTAHNVDPGTLEPAWQSYLWDVVEYQDQPRQGV